ncbi:MAG TPA: AAA family ATPase [Candidatus Eisenbacteria bacterium]
MPEAPTKPNQLFVISGCSGSGKSTLIAALAAQGEAVAMEPGREIVKDELQRGGDGLPWANTQRFIDLCAERTIRDFDRLAAGGRRAFFDRSFIDVASAVELSGLKAPAPLPDALRSKRYAPFVFMSPPWEALFHPDEERRHTFADSLAEYEMLVPTYRKHGYGIVFLPQTSVAERVAFVLSQVS